ncbi:hypothetical protein LAZ67_6002136 [Cordylochernes scorpioides]|uniref:Mos1 transposase HTH domain-containing protein n=1 Tax=Cordylochernes scorpioides TaxID=51811 RepID=A0ABY6KJZ8_9ARAC|nr:hypothetical protein LAZ67_6002136 [Cordylochernes scorpioides]
MEQKLKQRICIEFCVKLQISATDTFEMLNKAFPNNVPKRTTVFEWHSRFKAGRIFIEDDPRQGRPTFQRTDENVQKITDLIKENPRTTLLELGQDTGISKTTIGRIVTEDLRLKKTPAKFIPRFLTNEQKLCRLATCEDMLEMTRTDPEWKDKIITGDETWVYGYDPETKRQSAEWRGQDIAPNDFFLFPKLKAVLKGRHFDTREDIIEKSLLALKSIPKEAYKNCFDNWVKRWRWSLVREAFNIIGRPPDLQLGSSGSASRTTNWPSLHRRSQESTGIRPGRTGQAIAEFSDDLEVFSLPAGNSGPRLPIACGGTRIALMMENIILSQLRRSVGSKADALKFKEESVEIFGTAKMDLREWEIGPSSKEKQVPVLGLFWNLRTDELTCDLRSFAKKMEPGKVTRRKILSAAHSLFDPIGFTCPFTIIPEMLLQEFYGVKAGWDTDLSEDISRRFNAWLSQLTEVDKLKIPRCVVQSQDRRTWTLHIFMDSSNAAFAVCAYLRNGFPGSVQVQLLMARSRVAPMKNTTIPRLELVA